MTLTEAETENIDYCKELLREVYKNAGLEVVIDVAVTGTCQPETTELDKLTKSRERRLAPCERCHNVMTYAIHVCGICIYGTGLEVPGLDS